MPYTLQNDGDDIEKNFYIPFIKPSFPSYEVFWQKFVTQLTNRPADIHFCTDAKLAKLGFSSEHICMAQLHYTVLVQLCRCHDLERQKPFTIHHLVFAMSSLVGAQDVAFELLERFETRGSGTYDPWLDKRPHGAGANIKGGKEAQDEWKRKEKYPLQDIRDYRNQLVHGRNAPAIFDGRNVAIPKLGKQKQYLVHPRSVSLE